MKPVEPTIVGGNSSSSLVSPTRTNMGKLGGHATLGTQDFHIMGIMWGLRAMRKRLEI